MSESKAKGKDVMNDGDILLVLDGDSDSVEKWVKRVAEVSGQQVDWGYVAGRVLVKYIGDYGLAMSAVHLLLWELADRSLPYDPMFPMGYPYIRSYNPHRSHWELRDQLGRETMERILREARASRG